MQETPSWYWTGPPKPCEHFACHSTGLRVCEYTYKHWDSIVADVNLPHDILDCPGGCSQPFHNVANIQLAHADAAGVRWGEVAYFWDQEESARLTPEDIAEKAQAQTKREETQRLESEAIRMSNFMRDIEIKRGCKGEKEKPKIQSPCKYLYCTPGTEGRYQNSICSECWAYQYHCPKTGKLIKAQKGKECPYLHPGETGWLNEWNTDRRFGNSGRSSPNNEQKQNNRFSNLVVVPKPRRFAP